ncbi:glycosyltransferase family 4 protein [Capnocytophaga canis]|uniref:glycosyltransferase family 4 protein n=1 Tax=Capnocytophaga canis TaxID=1848903 RepID=UPI0037D821A9
MKHIAYITAEYPNKSMPPAGGIGSFVKVMADSLVKEGYKVTIFLCFSEEDKEWFDGDIRIVQIKKDNSKLAFLKSRWRINRIIRKYIKKYDINIIESPDWEGLHAFCKFPIPLITRLHGSVTYFNALENKKNSLMIYFLEKLALMKSKSIVSVSDFAGKMTAKVFKIKQMQYKIIYNGVNIHDFTQEKLEVEPFTLLYFGTLVRKKGVLELPFIFNEVVKKIPQAQLILAGKDTVDWIEKKSTWELMSQSFSEKAKKNVHYFGAVPYEKMSELIQKAIICVFPSFAEAFPISWLEAMAMKKVIVASDIGWAKESIENNKSGLLVNPKNHLEYAEKIVTLFNNVDLAEKIGQNARERVQNLFDQNKIIKQNIELYRSLCKN